MKDTNNYSTIALVAIIAIVAVVAIITFIPGNSGNNLQLPPNTALVQQNTDAAAENLAGEAFARTTPTTKTEYVAKRIVPSKPPTSPGAGKGETLVRVVAAGDNEFAIYHRDSTGNIIFDGRDQDGNNWNTVVDVQFTADIDDYIYFAAWDDASVARGLIADIFLDGELTYSTNNLGDWEVYETDLPPAYNSGGDAPTPYLIQSLALENDQFHLVDNTVVNGNGVWPFFGEMSSDAYWIWGDELMSAHISSITSHKQFMLFRVKVIPQSIQEYTITGYVYTHPNGKLSGLSGASIINEEGQTMTVTDHTGYYSFGYQESFTGSISAEIGSWIFYPEERVYTDLTESLTEQNFVGCDVSGLTISGKVTTNNGLPVQGLQMWKGTTNGGSSIKSTNTAGNYIFSVPFGWSGVIAPSEHQCVERFEPVLRNYVDLWDDEINQDYIAVREIAIVDAYISWSGSSTSLTWSHWGKDCFSQSGLPMKIANGNLGKGSSTYVLDEYYQGDTVTIKPTMPGFTVTPAQISCIAPCSMDFTAV